MKRLIPLLFISTLVPMNRYLPTPPPPNSPIFRPLSAPPLACVVVGELTCRDCHLKDRLIFQLRSELAVLKSIAQDGYWLDREK